MDCITVTLVLSKPLREQYPNTVKSKLNHTTSSRCPSFSVENMQRQGQHRSHNAIYFSIYLCNILLSF